MKILLIVILVIPTCAYADLAYKMSKLVGYTIISSEKITGYKDPDEKSEEGYFKGCVYGRIIFFYGNKALVCSDIGVDMSVMPTAIILVNKSNYKMIVDNDIYDMKLLDQ